MSRRPDLDHLDEILSLRGRATPLPDLKGSIAELTHKIAMYELAKASLPDDDLTRQLFEKREFPVRTFAELMSNPAALVMLRLGDPETTRQFHIAFEQAVKACNKGKEVKPDGKPL